MAVLPTDPKVKPIDQVNAKQDACAWCNWENKDELKGELKKAVKNVVRNVGHKWQCETCGKMWEVAQLGKPYSVELERGMAWVREKQARELTER